MQYAGVSDVWWCAECARTHRLDEHARAVLGDRGVARIGVAYAWCARESAYHLVKLYTDRADRVTRYDVCERPHGLTRAPRIARFPMRTRSALTRKGVRIVRPPAPDAHLGAIRARAYARYRALTPSPSQGDNATRARIRAAA